jgi:aminoglycoside phosphotransferase family enzyme/predicted kinase
MARQLHRHESGRVAGSVLFAVGGPRSGGNDVTRITRQTTGEPHASGESDSIVVCLLDPTAYEERPVRVECIETHISWVFLTDRFAYKLKKPVRFDFLDFSTSELRHQACQAEVRLNRRLAQDVYLGVVPVTERNGRISLGGDGTPIDWVVKMHRLPVDRSLDRLIQSGELPADAPQQLARLLAHFFTNLPPLSIGVREYRGRLVEHVRSNRDELLAAKTGVDPAIVRRVHELQFLMLNLAPDVLEDRAWEGRIVDGHGDLRPEHIYLAPTPVIIDCIEFNAEFRQLDVVDELCFLAMECERLGAGWIGDEILSQYRLASGDCPSDKLLAFYKCYRACVRAKVCELRAGQVHGKDKALAEHSSADYLALADKYRAEIGRPVLLTVRGLTGTGKTVLARQLSERLEIERLETDAIRRELFGESKSPAEFGADIYRQENRARVYEEMLSRTRKMIDAGRSVILDGTFLGANTRAEALACAADGRAVPLVIHCHCSDDLARQRIAARRASGESLSESRPEIHARQKELEEPDPQGHPVLRVDTADEPVANVDAILARLGSDWSSENFRL